MRYPLEYLVVTQGLQLRAHNLDDLIAIVSPALVRSKLDSPAEAISRGLGVQQVAQGHGHELIAFFTALILGNHRQGCLRCVAIKGHASGATGPLLCGHQAVRAAQWDRGFPVRKLRQCTVVSVFAAWAFGLAKVRIALPMPGYGCGRRAVSNSCDGCNSMGNWQRNTATSTPASVPHQTTETGLSTGVP